ncbi:MAG: hypothetical protein NTX88_03680 [Candidatus Atribacteria bacterium]|nr:hypothetical protein [Candidatus Atribacteria bacterium]
MKRFVWMIILTFGALLVSFPSLAMTDGRWVIKGNISQSGRINFPAVEDNGRIYLLGGTTGKWGYSTNSVDVFDPQTGSWSSASPMKEKKSSFVGLAYQGKIYVVGGIREGGEIYLKTVEIYDPETNTWSKGNPMPSQRGWIKGAVANGKIYILGGVNPPSTKKMNPTSPAINEEGTYDLFNPHSQQQKYYVFHLTNEVETYDPSTNTWAQGPAMKDSLYNFALASLNDTIYLFGGEDQSGKVQDTLYILNTRTNSWSQGATLPVARANFQAVVLENKDWEQRSGITGSMLWGEGSGWTKRTTSLVTKSLKPEK